jgi:polysaccharide export outer membrane protein
LLLSARANGALVADHEHAEEDVTVGSLQLQGSVLALAVAFGAAASALADPTGDATITGTVSRAPEAPASPAPAQAAATTGDTAPAGEAVALPAPGLPVEAYRFGPEDVIEVFVWKEPDLSTTAIVRPDGRITLPLAGELEAAGKSAEELKSEIETSLANYIAKPLVTVMVKAINSPQISVLGEIKKPGRYRIAQRATILDAIALGGGFTEFAKPKSVVVLRRTPEGVKRIQVDVKDLLANGSEPLPLRSGDTIYVE